MSERIEEAVGRVADPIEARRLYVRPRGDNEENLAAGTVVVKKVVSFPPAIGELDELHGVLEADAQTFDPPLPLDRAAATFEVKPWNRGRVQVAVSTPLPEGTKVPENYQRDLAGRIASL